METSSDDSSSGGVLLVDEHLSTTDAANHRKRLPCPLVIPETKRRRLEEEDMETSSRESRWSQYRDCTNLSTLTEQSDTANALPEGCNLHVAAHQVPDLEDHIEKLAMELQEWSLVNLKQWRQQQFGEATTTTITNGCSPTKQSGGRRSKEAVKKQKAAKRKLMRALRHHDTGISDAMEE